MKQEVGALSKVRIVDLTDERAIYGAKLLADMGADVVRPESPDGDPLRSRGPYCEDDANEPSLWHAFFASNRRFISLDLEAQTGRDQEEPNDNRLSTTVEWLPYGHGRQVASWL